MTNMKRFAIGIGILLFAASGYAATVTVAKDGSGVVNTVQAAFAVAQNGDEIVILDDGVYVEDAMTGAAFQMTASFTLRAADGKKPTIRSANQLPRLTTLGVPGVDHMGFTLLGCQNVLIEGITFENLSFESNVAKYGSAMTIGDSVGVTVRNCVFRGAGADHDSYHGGLNSNLFIVGLGVIVAPTNILIEDCTFENFFKGMTIAEWPNRDALADPSVIVRNCTFQNGIGGIDAVNSSYPESPNPATTLTGPGNLFEENSFNNLSGSGIVLSGGYSILNHNMFNDCYFGIDAHFYSTQGTSPNIGKINQCAFVNNKDCGLLVHVYEDEKNGDDYKVTIDVENCAFIGNKWHGVYVERGTSTFRNCTFAGNGVLGARVSNSTATVSAEFNHCNFYKNNQITYPDYPHFNEKYEIWVDTNPIATQAEFTNCIIVGERGILNSAYNTDPNSCIVSYCDIFTQADPLKNATGDHILNVDPQFVSPKITWDESDEELAGFKLPNGSVLLTAGKDGTYIGAWGPDESEIGSWDLYQ